MRHIRLGAQLSHVGGVNASKPRDPGTSCYSTSVQRIALSKGIVADLELLEWIITIPTREWHFTNFTLESLQSDRWRPLGRPSPGGWAVLWRWGARESSSHPAPGGGRQEERHGLRRTRCRSPDQRSGRRRSQTRVAAVTADDADAGAGDDAKSADFTFLINDRQVVSRSRSAFN
jgi:hypothetical protein